MLLIEKMQAFIECSQSFWMKKNRSHLKNRIIV